MKPKAVTQHSGGHRAHEAGSSTAPSRANRAMTGAGPPQEAGSNSQSAASSSLAIRKKSGNPGANSTACVRGPAGMPRRRPGPPSPARDRRETTPATRTVRAQLGPARRPPRAGRSLQPPIARGPAPCSCGRWSERATDPPAAPPGTAGTLRSRSAETVPVRRLHRHSPRPAAAAAPAPPTAAPAAPRRPRGVRTTCAEPAR